MVMVFTYGNNNSAWGYAHRLFTLFGSVATIGIVAMLFQQERIKVHQLLTSSSFFVYAAHGPIVLPIIQFALEKVIPGNQAGLILMYFAAPIITVALLVLCYYYLRKWMPDTLAVLTGGRGK